MINVEAEVSKHKLVKDRGEFGRLIREYKNLAVQHANNLVVSGQYDMVAHRLQELSDKLPAPNIKKTSAAGAQSGPVQTAEITKAEKSKINAAWNKRTHQ
ncbi:MAG: hypothetical protein FWC01_05795 [Treponema sp.]|nr:hypothetical protein [Treponema sp.]MCL2237377.1 hypothetical protein [Treponema sp.]